MVSKYAVSFKKASSCTGVDCGELADKLYDVSGQQGNVIRIEPTKGNHSVKTPESKGSSDYVYHEVYTDGKYVFDPRLSETPIPKGDYIKLIKSLNPYGVSITKVK